MTKGLEGTVAAETRLSQVDGEAGRLVVRGHNIDSLAADTTYEGMASLLWQDLAPEPTGEAALRDALGEARRAAFDRLDDLLPPPGSKLGLMASLRAAIARLPEEPAAHLAACGAAPVVIAAAVRRRDGEDPVAPDPGLRQAADMLRMLDGEPPSGLRARALETYLVTVADHGMNASTFAARVVASTRAGMVPSLTAALCALEGPLHGGAPGPVLDMLDAIGSEGNIETWLEEALERGERLMGFGHRVYRTRDPRADVLKGVVTELRSAGDARLAFAEKVEAAALKALAERHPDRPLDTNVEFYTALALEAVGLPRDAFTAAFATGRLLGWAAHVFEQEQTGRLLRPASRYIGPWPDDETPRSAVAG